MTLSEHAAEYVKRNGLRAKVIISNCRRFERFTSITEPERISGEVITAFRQASMAMGLSNVTTEKTITDVLTIVKSVATASPDAGKRLRQPRPEPKPATLSDIDAVFRAAESDRLRRWLAIAYWTGLRVSDSIEVYVTLRKPVETIRHRASKTGLSHSWPVPAWLREWMRPPSDPAWSTAWFGVIIRRELSETCERAGTRLLTPKQIRQASITEWTRANATAGAIVHGSGLGVMAHYLDPLSVLESAAPRVRLPECFGASSDGDTESTLLSAFRRLDPAAQLLISGTAERLAAG